MAEGPLAGKKIAVLVESEYIPEEILAYRIHFEKLGAEVVLVTRLWGQPKQTFFATRDTMFRDNQGEFHDHARLVELLAGLGLEAPDTYFGDVQGGVQDRWLGLDRLDVEVDFDQVNACEFAAVLMAANYTSVRLRYFESGDDPRLSPAVRFFAEAMGNPAVVKGALCHGLWILTPTPEVLRGREVICHRVVLADVLNAGAVYKEDSSGVVVDGDLVTGRSKHEATDAPDGAAMPPYIRAIVDRLGEPDTAAPPPARSQ